ncbi:MAG: hypothetical protein COT84_01215 [Chlamydiae bacterium CG10_big_fil_rev_8_21_14_0_10_35_9]|nr:MAG: hypothetical protein COT84_01215 [Chlamydiae bacterium CG10_big_fil_rev_8_21_14_0_10_35_9]
MALDYDGFAQEACQEVHYINPASHRYHATIRPSDRDLSQYVDKILSIFSDGLQWRDLPVVMKLSLHYLEDFTNLGLEEKRDSVVHILYEVIDKTDTPYLPDSFSDPLFKKMAIPFVDLIVPESLEDFLPSVKQKNEPSDEIFEEYASEVYETFENGFHWKDLVTVTRVSILFANQFDSLSLVEKKDTAKKFLAMIIDNTDTPYLPDQYADPIFKEVSNSCIDMIMDQLLIL